jgi:hypothetical protein
MLVSAVIYISSIDRNSYVAACGRGEIHLLAINRSATAVT